MAFWENFSETISVKSKEMADKAKNFTDIASLKGQIVSYENTISRYYREIGREYYQTHKNDMQPEFSEYINSIKDAEHMITALEKRISELKGTQQCSSCGYDVPNDSIFCPKCGSKLNDDTFCDSDNAIVTDVVVTEIIEED